MKLFLTINGKPVDWFNDPLPDTNYEVIEAPALEGIKDDLKARFGRKLASSPTFNFAPSGFGKNRHERRRERCSKLSSVRTRSGSSSSGRTSVRG